MMRYERSYLEWSIIQPVLPAKSRGVPRVDDRRVLNGIFWVLRSGATWRDLPDCYGPYTTCYNHFNRWREPGIWDNISMAMTDSHDADIQMLDTSIVRVHQHASCIAKSESNCTGRSRGGLTTKIHAVVDANGLPLRWRLAPGKTTTVCSPAAGFRSESLAPGAFFQEVTNFDVSIGHNTRHYLIPVVVIAVDRYRQQSCATVFFPGCTVRYT